MKKAANFIVEKRKIILITFVLLALVCVWLSTKVSINSDMTKYLPDESPMKIGFDIMESEFPAACSVNVMFEGLSISEKTRIYAELSEIENVQSVSYDAESEKYNKDDYTLYNVTMGYGSYSPEAKAVVEAIRKIYPDTVMSGEAAGNVTMNLTSLFLIAIAILLVILFSMCNSWIEPLLFLANIGVAILLNMGTNVIFNDVSDITKSIASILQLVLSMDYSVMLLNRYRQEKQTEPNKPEAMKKALVNAFTAISSSSVTTIVGMLMLVFMSFTIGLDLGLVLAKGVFFSLLCIFTVLSALILMTDGLIKKTAKKSLHIKMDKIASFGYSARFFMLAGFVILFVISFLLRSNVEITYTMSDYNMINQVFAPNNSVVVVYDNSDEGKIAVLAEKWEENAFVDSINAYSTTLGNELTSADFADAADMDESMADLLYYYYFNGNEASKEAKIPLSDFLRFIQDDVATNESFSERFTEDTLNQLDKLSVFTGTDKLTAKMTSAEIADFFDIEESSVSQIFVFYFSKYGGADSGKMTLNTFVKFIQDDLSEQFPSYLDGDAFSQIDKLAVFTDTDTVTKKMSGKELSAILGMDSKTLDQLFMYYFSTNGGVDYGTMTLGSFVSFIQKDVATNAQYSQYFNDSTLTQVNMLAAFTDKNTINAQLDSNSLSRMAGIDVAAVEQIFYMHSGSMGAAQTMSVYEFVGFVVTDVAKNENFASDFDPAALQQLGYLRDIMDAAQADKVFTNVEMAEIMGMDVSMINQLYLYHTSLYGNTGSWKMSLKQLVDLIINDVAKKPQFSSMLDAANIAQLQTMQKIINGTIAGTSYTSAELAKLLDMDKEMSDMVFLYHESIYGDTSGLAMSMQTFVDFIINDIVENEAFAGSFDASSLEQLETVQKIINAVLDGRQFTTAEISELLDFGSDMMNKDTIGLMYLFYYSAKNRNSDWKLPVHDFMQFIVNNVTNDEQFSAFFSDSDIEKLNNNVAEMDDGLKQLVGNKYSRLIINTSLKEESAETFDFLDELKRDLSSTSEYYIVGNSAMAYEMSGSFPSENNFITILTAISIFLVVAIAFRSISVPAVLVLVIQCAVFITMGSGSSIYYLPLLIVQCLLMGATIDYGILYTSYYREARALMDKKEAAISALNNSIHTVLTSGLILVGVTFILGIAHKSSNHAVSEILLTIGKGACCSMVLVVFILPSLLAALDRFVCRKIR